MIHFQRILISNLLKKILQNYDIILKYVDDQVFSKFLFLFLSAQLLNTIKDFIC